MSMEKCRKCRHVDSWEKCEKCYEGCNFEGNTNGNKIRAMSDEELAEFLDIVEQDGIESQYSGVPCDCCTEKTECCSCWKEWLKSEVKE